MTFVSFLSFRRLLAAVLFSAGLFLVLPVGAADADVMAAVTADVESGSAGLGYRLGVGDRLGISVLGESDLTLEVLINHEGAINYPFLGEIKVAGSTLHSLRERITQGLKPDYLIDPRVTVQVIEYRNFYVNGEVQKPGGFPWQPGMTVRKAAALAGGFTLRASRSRLNIIRETDITRQPVPVTIDAEVQPGDIITIDQSFF